MKIVAYTYVDHQGEIGYPIRLCTGNLSMCEAIHFFGSDAENTRLLEAERESHPLRDRISCHTINIKVNAPHDIAIAQNACLDWIRKNETFDFMVGIQADTFLSPRALKAVDQFCCPEQLPHALILPVDHVRAYAVAHRTVFGCTIVGKDSKALFVGDGAYPNIYKTLEMAQNDLDPYCVDVGYYTPEMYYRHVRRNAKTWQSSVGTALADTYTRNRDEFIRGCLVKVRTYERGDIPLTPIDPLKPEHQVIMDYFKCHEDFRHVLGIIEKLRKEI